MFSASCLLRTFEKHVIKSKSQKGKQLSAVAGAQLMLRIGYWYTGTAIIERQQFLTYPLAVYTGACRRGEGDQGPSRLCTGVGYNEGIRIVHVFAPCFNAEEASTVHHAN